MLRSLPPLPQGFEWYSGPAGSGTLKIWGVYAVALVEPMHGGWRTRVNVCFHASLQREVMAGNKRQACYWIHRWVIPRAEAIYRARPRACVAVVPKSLAG